MHREIQGLTGDDRDDQGVRGAYSGTHGNSTVTGLTGNCRVYRDCEQGLTGVHRG